MIRFLAVLGILGISFSAVFVRLADVSPATAAFFRAAYALPPLFLLWMMTRGGDHRSASMRWMAAGSGLFLALDLTVWHRSIELIGAGLATVLANTQIAFVGLIAWAIHRERPTALAFGTIPIVFGGVVLISGLGRADAYGDDPPTGAALGVVTGMAYTGFLLVFRASNRGLAPP
ncbi:MAG TPA: EamA family transporter, partial [Dehalococcoidia bacterium]|nr:EamA family transporter [Dehalococcoidia bacterium]